MHLCGPLGYCWFLSSTPFRGLAGIFNRAWYCCILSSTPFRGWAGDLHGDCCSLSSVYLRGLAVLLGILNPIKTLYLNPHSVSELFGPNPHILTATEAQSVTVCVYRIGINFIIMRVAIPTFKFRFEFQNRYVSKCSARITNIKYFAVRQCPD